MSSAANTDAAVEVRGASKRFGRVWGVREASFVVPRGSVTGVLGPNGAGKTTTIRMITGTLPPTSGEVLVEGLDAVERSLAVRRRLGYLPESNALYPEMRVGEYLRFRGGLFGLRGRRAGRRIGEVAERCWLTGALGRRVGTLSKGFRQRVGLAAAMLHEPAILILDEPTSGLDPVQIGETRGLVRELAGDHTMVIVSHILPEVERTCDRLVVFAGGRVRASGTPGELMERFGGDGGWEVSFRGGEGGDAGVWRGRLSGLAGVRSCEVEAEGDGWLAARVVFDAAQRGAGGERLGVLIGGGGGVVRRLGRRVASLEAVFTRLVLERGDEAADGGDP